MNAREIRFVAGRDDDLTSVEFGEHIILALSVELGEHVVEKENGIFSAFLAGDLSLSELHRKRDASLLTLRCEDLRVHTAELDLEIVLMRAADGGTDDDLSFEVLRKYPAVFFKVCRAVEERFRFLFRDVRKIRKSDLLSAARHIAEITVHETKQARQIFCADLGDISGVLGKLFRKDLRREIEGLFIFFIVFEKGVSLLEQLFVFHQRREIRAIELGDRGIQKSASLTGLVFDDGEMLGAEKHSLEIADKSRHFTDLHAVFEGLSRHLAEDAVAHFVCRIREM